jgi:hypothetical protein
MSLRPRVFLHFSGRDPLVRTVLTIGTILSVPLLIALLVSGYLEQQHSDELRAQRHAWDWSHYTGWRLTPDASQPAERGIMLDHKIGGGMVDGGECSTKNYPNYPACPAQEFHTGAR